MPREPPRHRITRCSPAHPAPAGCGCSSLRSSELRAVRGVSHEGMGCLGCSRGKREGGAGPRWLVELAGLWKIRLLSCVPRC